MENANLLSPSTLCFVGDVVYSLYVRMALARVNRPSKELHSLSVKLVNASAQSNAFKLLEHCLTEDEILVFKRGRNFHTTSCPKNSTKSEYQTATGLECLFGFLYLSHKNDRAEELFEIIWKNFTDNVLSNS